MLPALLLFFAVGGPPFPGSAQTLLLSAVVGIGYILLTGVSRSLGYGGAMPPAIGGWGPILVGGGRFLGGRSLANPFMADPILAAFFGAYACVRLWRRS